MGLRISVGDEEHADMRKRGGRKRRKKEGGRSVN